MGRIYDWVHRLYSGEDNDQDDDRLDGEVFDDDIEDVEIITCPYCGVGYFADDTELAEHVDNECNYALLNETGSYESSPASDEQLAAAARLDGGEFEHMFDPDGNPLPGFEEEGDFDPEDAERYEPEDHGECPTF